MVSQGFTHFTISVEYIQVMTEDWTETEHYCRHQIASKYICSIVPATEPNSTWHFNVHMLNHSTH